MGARLTKRQLNVLDMLASGHSERETYLRLKLSESQFAEDWQAIQLKLQTSVPVDLADYQLLSKYERVGRMQLEAELWASEARLTALMDTSTDVVFLINGRSGRILKFNNRALIVFGYSPRELQNELMEMLIAEDVRSKHVGLRNGFLNSIRKREMGYHPPIQARKKDGTIVEMDIALTATASTDDVMVVCKVLEEGCGSQSQTEGVELANGS